jgi:hypothetical protein
LKKYLKHKFVARREGKMKANWTKWEFFEEEGICGIPEKEGVYQFRCIDEDGHPKPIKRLLGNELEGIIYIGKSKNLQKRINGFWTTIQKQDRSRHAASWTYVSYNYYPIFSPKHLQYRYFVAKNPIANEFFLLLSYRKKFMDLPPLNSNMGNYPGGWEGKWVEIIGRKPLPE